MPTDTGDSSVSVRGKGTCHSNAKGLETDVMDMPWTHHMEYELNRPLLCEEVALPARVPYSPGSYAYLQTMYGFALLPGFLKPRLLNTPLIACSYTYFTE